MLRCCPSMAMAISLSEFPPNTLHLRPPSFNHPPTFLCFSTKPNSTLSNSTHKPSSSSQSPVPKSTPNPAQLENRLRRSIRSRNYDESLSLVESMATHGHKLNIILCSDLIEGFSGSGRTDLADRVMELIEFHSQPNNFLYNVFVTGLCNNNRAIMALETLGRMRLHKCRPNILMGNILLGSMCRAGMLDLAIQTVDYLEQQYNCKPNLITYNILVEGTVIKKGTRNALKLLDQMAAKGIIPDYNTYNSVVRGMCKANRPDEAWKFLNRLPARGFKPRVVSYCALLQTLLENERWTDVDRMLDEFFERACEPRYVHVSEMVHVLCQKGVVDKAWSVIDQTERKWKLKPDAKCRNMVIYAYIKLGRMDLASEFINHMSSMGCAPDISTYNEILSGLCKQGLVQQAMQIIDQMEASGLHPNTGSYYQVARGLWTLGDLTKAADLLSQMLRKGLKPDEAIYSGLISGFCKEGFVDEAIEAKRLMEENGISPTTAIYNWLLQGLAKMRRIAEAIDLFEEMLNKGLEPNEKTYTVILVGLAHMGYVLEAAEILKELADINVLAGEPVNRLQRKISKIA